MLKFSKICILVFFIFLISKLTFGSDLIKAQPVNSSIIQLTFDDGYIQKFGYQEQGDDDIMFSNPLDLADAMNVLSYQIQSDTDPSYDTPANPLNIFRKSRGDDFSRACNWNGAQCINDIVFNHSIYLELPSSMITGNVYSVDLSDLAFNVNSIQFQFDEFTSRSEAVHVNQIGYIPSAQSKFGYLSYWMGDGGGVDFSSKINDPFYIVDRSNNEIVYTGTIEFRSSSSLQETAWVDQTPQGNFQNADVYQMDFSGFNGVGEFVLSIPGVGCSYPFQMNPDVLREAFYHTARGLYFQRAGIDKAPPFAEHYHPADHHPQINGTVISYTNAQFMYETSEDGDQTSAESQITQTLNDFYGWYHDAGDWDGYARHTEVPKTLMLAYECGPDRFFDAELNIPESGNGIPDILDEAFWLINYYRRNTGPTGGKFGSRIHGNFEYDQLPEGTPSWEDPRDWIVFGEDVWTSLEFAGLASNMAHCLTIAEEQTGQDFSDLKAELISEASTAYAWAQSNYDPNDLDLVREQWLYASANLFRTTSDVSFQNDFINYNSITSNATSDDFRALKWGLWPFALIEDDFAGLNTSTHSLIVNQALAHADFENLFVYDDLRSFRFSGNYWQPMAVGQGSTPQCNALMVGYKLSENELYLQAMQTTADYFLGGNQMNMCWISGLGDNYPKEILHLDSWFDDSENPIRGIVPYGPSKAGDQFDGTFFVGPWDADYNRELAVYPAANEWPGHQMFFNNRYTVITNEFTTEQSALAVTLYGFLSSPEGTNIPNEYPEGMISSHEDGDVLYLEDRTLAVEAQDVDGNVEYVEYFFDWHKIGESTTGESFELEWIDAEEGTYDVYAKIYDNEGLSFTTESISITIEDSFGCSADLNNDLLINIDDLLILLANFGCPQDCENGDINNDGAVNAADALDFLAQFGTTCF